ncbi:MAG TPA: hypothetical protein VF166_11515 [Gemmatimonadaceae bacterium]
MSAPERVYALLLRAYPSEFREAYGREMLQLFRDQRREVGVRGMRFWSAILWDVARSAPALQLDSFRGQWGVDIQTGGAMMKVMAVLAVVVGALEILNTLVETFAGGLAGRSGGSLLALALAVLAPALLLLSGVALLVRPRRTATLARGAALICLVVFAAIATLQPIFSVASTVLGIGFPIVLLLFLFRKPRGGQSTSTAA